MPFSVLQTVVRRSLQALSAVAIGLSILVASGVQAAETVTVNVDQAKLIKLTGRVATLVVGNPLIADVALQPGGIIVVTGKGYGATNVIAMDRSGEVLEERIVQVQGPAENLVTVYRGVERESYTCQPICERRVTLGDSAGYFKATMDQADSLSSQAAAGGGGSAK